MYLPINKDINNCKSTIEKLLQEENRKPAAFYHLIDLQKIMLVSTDLVGVTTQKCRVYVKIKIQSSTTLVDSLDYNVERFVCSCQNGNMKRLVLSRWCRD